MRTNLILVIVLILIAGLIFALSFIMKPMPRDANVLSGQSTVITDTSPMPGLGPVLIPSKIVLDQIFDCGLSWLVTKQLASGSFPDLEGKDDVAFTAIALIILGEAPEITRIKYRDNISRALAFMLKSIQPNGSIMDTTKIPSFDIYKTSLGIVALKSNLPFQSNEDQKKYSAILANAVAYLQKAQYGPESTDNDQGGWGYKEKGTEKTPGTNLSTTAYVLDALHESGLSQDSDTYKRAVEFLQKCQDNSEYNKYRITANSGGFYYSPDESKADKAPNKDKTQLLKPYGSMTYAGLLSFIYSSVDKKDPRVQSAYNWIRGKYTLEENPGLRTDAEPELGKQGLFYYYHTFAKALDAYGEKKIITTDNVEHFWANELVKKLETMQHKDGSWSNDVSRWWEDFPLLATSYALMSLDICRKWVD